MIFTARISVQLLTNWKNGDIVFAMCALFFLENEFCTQKYKYMSELIFTAQIYKCNYSLFSLVTWSLLKSTFSPMFSTAFMVINNFSIIICTQKRTKCTQTNTLILTARLEKCNKYILFFLFTTVFNCFHGNE